MYESGEPEPIQEPKIYEQTIYLESTKAGLWYPKIKEQSRVVKGQVLGHLEDMFGNVLQEFCAEGDGVVFYYMEGLSARERDILVAYGLEER